MAEGLGVVASSIAVAGLAEKLAKGVVRLKDFWDQVKDAPDEIAHILREIESLDLILADISEGQRIPDLVVDNVSLKRSLKLCEDAVVGLSHLVDELSTKISMKSGMRRKAGAMKIVLKKDKLNRYKSQMESTIRLVSLAYQYHTRAMIMMQPELIVARVAAHVQAHGQTSEIATLIDTEPTDVRRSEPASGSNIVHRHYDYWTLSESWMGSLLGSFEYRQDTWFRRRKCRPEFHAKYKLPPWLSATVLHVRGYKMPTWHLNLKFYRVLQEDHPFIAAVRDGNIYTVQKMLSEQPSLVVDRFGPKERTAIYHAARLRNLEISVLLEAEGADVLAADIFNVTPLQALMAKFSSVYSESNKYMDMCRFFMKTTAINDLENDLMTYNGTLEAFRYLLEQLDCPYSSMPVDYQMFVATHNCHRFSSLSGDRIAIMNLALPSAKTVTLEMANWKGDDGMMMLHQLAFQLILWQWEPELRSPSPDLFMRESHKKDYCSLLTSFVLAGAPFHATIKPNTTPLAILLLGIASEETLWICLNVLMECGLDLQIYGDEERDIGTFDCLIDSSGMERFMSYGPRPSDWQFWYREESDKFSGEFWELVEIGQLKDMTEDYSKVTIPGAWKDEEAEGGD